MSGKGEIRKDTGTNQEPENTQPTERNVIRDITEKRSPTGSDKSRHSPSPTAADRVKNLLQKSRMSHETERTSPSSPIERRKSQTSSEGVEEKPRVKLTIETKKSSHTEWLRDKIEGKISTYIRYHLSAIDGLQEDERGPLKVNWQAYYQTHQRIEERMTQEPDLSRRIQAQEKYTKLQDSHIKGVAPLRPDPEISTHQDMRLQLLHNTHELMHFETTYLKETYLKLNQDTIDKLPQTDNPKSIQRLERTLQTYDQLHQRIQNRMGQIQPLAQRIEAQEAYTALQDGHVEEITMRSQNPEDATKDDIQLQLQQNTQELRAFEKENLPQDAPPDDNQSR